MLDHVVAVINGSVILQSDVQEEIRYGVLQPFSVNPARNTPQRALQRLIDAKGAYAKGQAVARTKGDSHALSELTQALESM